MWLQWENLLRPTPPPPPPPPPGGRGAEKRAPPPPPPPRGRGAGKRAPPPPPPQPAGGGGRAGPPPPPPPRGGGGERAGGGGGGKGSHANASNVSFALKTVTWVGAITALFAALIAVAQTDLKRILAYSTVSQLGYMMIGLGVGGVAVGMFHLITHAFFKALLFLGAGSVIHGCHEEQDIRRMGGLKDRMPVTFATYAIGMMALSGVPLFFSGFWSKDDILHAARAWDVSKVPFILCIAGAFLTAFYMTRQVCYVFFGERKAAVATASGHGPV